jgi:hypothetical protein
MTIDPVCLSCNQHYCQCPVPPVITTDTREYREPDIRVTVVAGRVCGRSPMGGELVAEELAKITRRAAFIPDYDSEGGY